MRCSDILQAQICSCFWGESLPAGLIVPTIQKRGCKLKMQCWHPGRSSCMWACHNGGICGCWLQLLGLPHLCTFVRTHAISWYRWAGCTAPMPMTLQCQHACMVAHAHCHHSFAGHFLVKLMSNVAACHRCASVPAICAVLPCIASSGTHPLQIACAASLPSRASAHPCLQSPRPSQSSPAPASAEPTPAM